MSAAKLNIFNGSPMDLIDKNHPFFTEAALSRVGCDYIPQKLLRGLDTTKVQCRSIPMDDDGEAMVKILLANSNHLLRMYGTAEELAANLKIYRNFPMSHRKFDLDAIDPYFTKPILYRNQNGDQFLHKSDIFVYLQTMFSLTVRDTYHGLIHPFLAIILKSYEERLVGCCEFVQYDPKMMQELFKKFQKLREQSTIEIRNHPTKYSSYIMPASVKKPEKMLQYFKNLLPTWNSEEYFAMECILKQYFDRKEPGNRQRIGEMYILFKLVIEHIQKAIQQYPNAFLPYSEKSIILQLNKNAPISVRIFEDNGQQFVMKAELFKSMKLRNPDKKFVAHEDTDGRLMTMSMEEVKRKYSDKIGQIERRPFFITIDKLRHEESELISFWERFEKQPAKDVRNAKIDGFTLENLRNELKNLGFVALFPDILTFTKGVYEKVKKAKTEQYLRTCDLFEAVEKCVILCVLDRIPNFKLFIHTQNACHRVPSLSCPTCKIYRSAATTTYKNSKWNEYKYKESAVVIKEDEPDNRAHYELKCPDGNFLVTNLMYIGPVPMSYFFRDRSKMYFLLDTKDQELFLKKTALPKKNMKKATKALKDLEILNNLENFLKFHPKKRIYLRAIPSTCLKREESRTVFAEEVLEIIPILRRQQGKPLDAKDDRLKTYRKKWVDDEDLAAVPTLTLPELWYLLEEFDVDKSLLTIVPDPVYEMTMNKMIENMNNTYLYVYTPYGELAVRCHHAIFALFQNIVCDVSWNRQEVCGRQLAWLKELRETIVRAMRAFINMGETCYVTEHRIELATSSIRKHHHLDARPSEMCETPLTFLKSLKFDAPFPTETLIEQCIMFGLTEYLDEHLGNLKKEKLCLAYQARSRFLMAFWKCFYEHDIYDICDPLTMEMMFRHPMKVVFEDGKKLKGNVGIRSQYEFKLKPKTRHRKPVKPSDDYIEQIEKMQNLKLETSPKSATKAAERAPQLDGSVKKEHVSVPFEESKCCSKCLRTAEICNEARKDLKLAQNKLEKYEKKAKKTEELEKKLKEVQVEIGIQKKDNAMKKADLEAKNQEVESLKITVLKLEGNETRWKMRERNLNDTQITIMERVAQLETQLESEKTKLLELQNAEKLPVVKQPENIRKHKEYIRLQTTNSRLVAQNQDYQRIIRILKDRLAEAETPPPTPTHEDTVANLGPPTSIRYQLLNLQKIKDSFSGGYQLKQATDMVEKLISLSECPEIHQFSMYELQQFEARLQNYLQEVEMNIQKVKASANPGDVSSLPPPPALSDRFLREYWKEIDKSKGESGDTVVVEDTECMICFFELKPEEKQTLECEHCKKIMHLECASKWLQIHRSCPHCRREQLDPNEFPNLN
ncbi:hypothetical protein CAEBREN_24932 [Caenorhabditis brenneri]|uniref:RING-type domain-containing protein n=1 Tax=Caenorhabditis brenneri TaxID=135651 RepID=G0MWM1_CAEBE|nr:hypothetical protein CAEBREN_24932 [Caenorhabditis brenneri]